MHSFSTNHIPEVIVADVIPTSSPSHRRRSIWMAVRICIYVMVALLILGSYFGYQWFRVTSIPLWGTWAKVKDIPGPVQRAFIHAGGGEIVGESEYVFKPTGEVHYVVHDDRGYPLFSNKGKWKVESRNGSGLRVSLDFGKGTPQLKVIEFKEPDLIAIGPEGGHYPVYYMRER